MGQDTGLLWPDPDNPTTADLFGVYMKASNNALRLVGHGGGIEVTDKSLNVLMSISENPRIVKIKGNLEVTGDLSFGTGADLAEEFVSEPNITPGTVMIMGENGYKSAIISNKEHDNRVIGVVSDNAAITMGRVEGPNKSVIALVGVVKVKVIGYNKTIEKGDLLTTSRVRGHAMKAVDPKIGTIIGKALESFKGDKGEIMALINLQ
jgi:hypothetical protein